MTKKEYRLLEWFNTLYNTERGCWWDSDYDALNSLLNFIREKYNMVPSKCRDGEINRYTLTYVGEPDEYISDSTEKNDA